MVDDSPAIDVSSNKLGLHKYCLCNPWKDGLEKMKKSNHVLVTANSDARKDRKRTLSKFIIKTVRDARINNGSTIGKEASYPTTASWCNTVHELDIDYYRGYIN